VIYYILGVIPDRLCPVIDAKLNFPIGRLTQMANIYLFWRNVYILYDLLNNIKIYYVYLNKVGLIVCYLAHE